MKHSIRALQLFCCLAVFPAVTYAAVAKQCFDIVVPSSAAPQIKFGATELSSAIKGRIQTEVRIESRPSPQCVSITVQVQDRQAPGVVFNKPESFAINKRSSNSVVVTGSDTTGAMYGSLELAEQIAMAKGEKILDQIHAIQQSPFLEVRGVNHFPTTQDMEDEVHGGFWSDSYWNGFFDMLARNRYNLLDLHGPVDSVSLRFPTAFSYFVSLPEFPQVGVSHETAAKNMKRLQQIIRMAADRGIKVAYMNYEAAPPIGPWTSPVFGRNERWDERRTAVDAKRYLNGPQLEEYTRKAVTAFLQQLPDLWMFGFRIGESGQPEDFYKKTYLSALKDVPDSLNVYVRTWVADPDKVRELAASTPHRLFIEPKYNGEQLGSPYQAVLGGRDYAVSGSYENYTSYPRNFSVIWQIRAHGTHRVFFWGSPEFARRTMRSCLFGGGVGFSMEPMDAYGPPSDYLHNDPKVGHNVYPWLYQRQWLWHMVWGRTAYNPDVSDEVFRAEFVRRFGENDGLRVYDATVESSKIIPFIFAYHNAGLDHQEFAPEFETGDHSMSTAWMQRWTGDRLIPMGGDNQNFLAVLPIDRTAMTDPKSYVDDYLKQQPSGRMTPLEASDYLDAAAEKSERAIRQVSKHGIKPELDCIQRDVGALVAMGRYYADRIRSVTHLEFYSRTYAHEELTAAHRDLQLAINHWDELAQIADSHFGFVPELIRMGVNQYRWKDEGRTLGVDLDQIDKLEYEYQKLPLSPNYALVAGHLPPRKVKPGQALSLQLSLAGQPTNRHPKAISLFYRGSGQARYTEVAMQFSNPFVNTWAATIPADAITPGTIDYYFEAKPLRWVHSSISVGKPVPYSVPVNDNQVEPEVTHVLPLAGVRGDRVTLEIAVHAGAPVKVARVYYKAIPSYHEFVPLEMEKAGEGHYSAQVPLTSDGILYYFEAIDQDGNGTNYPNVLEQTPYLVIDSWDPGNP